MNYVVDEKFFSRKRRTGRNADAQLDYIITATHTQDAWDAETTYGPSSGVVYEGLEYWSLQPNNLNKVPPDEPDWWVETDMEDAATIALGSEAPATYQGLVRVDRNVQRIAPFAWDGIARYGRFARAAPEVEDEIYSFDTSGGTQHITQALATRAFALSGETAPDHNEVIGGDGERVEGVDITVKAYAFEHAHYYDNSDVTAAYVARLRDITGFVNNANWVDDKGITHAKGEALFLGARGSQRGTEDWEIEFRFAAIKNRGEFSVGSVTVTEDGNDVAKYGWEYMDVKYRNAEDATAKTIVPRPYAVLIHQVYEYEDFAKLEHDWTP